MGGAICSLLGRESQSRACLEGQPGACVVLCPREAVFSRLHGQPNVCVTGVCPCVRHLALQFPCWLDIDAGSGPVSQPGSNSWLKSSSHLSLLEAGTAGASTRASSTLFPCK